jgi:hypothetical protein
MMNGWTLKRDTRIGIKIPKHSNIMKGVLKNKHDEWMDVEKRCGNRK